MNITALAIISIILLVIACRLWLKDGDDASLCQGALLALVMVGWFLRIVLVG